MITLVSRGAVVVEMSVGQKNKIPVLEISGEIDHFVAPKLQRQIDDIIDKGAQHLIFDFTNVHYLDSGGIGVLFNAMQQLVPRRGQIVIVCDEENLIRILELVGLFDTRTNVSLCKDQKQALEDLGKRIEVG
ncbi:MAG TPA: anti-sigma factor antagonist [Actinobacteria bacterium]|nr:anti-sigma factor antagonist [Actinomycetota bacterium]